MNCNKNGKEAKKISLRSIARKLKVSSSYEFFFTEQLDKRFPPQKRQGTKVSMIVLNTNHTNLWLRFIQPSRVSTSSKLFFSRYILKFW
jgi:hypothetical protein